jgi:hypothetical protein
LSVDSIFDVNENDSVWDVWIRAVSLMSMLKYSQEFHETFFDKAKLSIYQVFEISEKHSIDKNISCICGLSYAEHALLKRNILKFYKLQLERLKLLILESATSS